MKHERADAAIGRFARRPRVIATSAMALGIAALAGCSSFEAKVPSLGYNGTIHRGYVADGRTIDNLKPGLSKEQVLSQLGTPSTTSTVGGDAWYYVSQTVERPLAFMPDKVTDQRVMAVYFSGGKMQRVANYGLQDGKLFDYVSRTTPVAGGDSTFVQNMIRSLLKFS